VLFKLRGDIFSNIYVATDGVYHFKTYVVGEWIDSKEYIEIKTPIDGSIIARVPKLSWDEIDKALDIVYNIGRWSIRDIPGWKRVEILNKIANLLQKYSEDFIEVLMVNTGKTRQQAVGELNASIDRLMRANLDARKIFGDYIPGDWDPTTIETEGIVRREPYGVVLAIIPFNYPLFDTVSKFVYSVVAGNAVVIKPPSADPIPVILFARVVQEAGFPKESLAVFTVPGRESDRLVSDRRVSVISFTGNSDTGKHILQVGGIKQYIMELGGGDPAIVLRDAAIDDAAKKIAAGIYSYAGQRCDAIKLILVEEPIYDEFKAKIIEELSKVKVGNPRNEDVQMGPLIDAKAVDIMLEAVREAVEKGAKILYGGRRLGATYVEPTLIEVLDKNVLKELRLYRDEVFAPVAIITPFKDLDEAISIANGRRYGLDVAIFGRDLERIRRLVRYLEFGAVYINDMPRHGVGY